MKPDLESQSHNAHVLANVTIYYRWHPFFQRSLRAVRHGNWPDGPHVHCELPDGTIARIPAWMLDPASCATQSLGTPEVSVGALMDLRQLLNGLNEEPDCNKSSPLQQSSEGTHEGSDQSDGSPATTAMGSAGGPATCSSQR
jgi:hypothetical protein